MATLPLLRYPLDTTGRNPDNYINGEVHTLSNRPVRALAPTYGAYFAESVKLYDNRTGQLLIRGTHYLCVELLQQASEQYGKEISYLVLITEPTVSPEVRIDYQVLGGLYTRSGDAIVNLYNTIMLDDTPVNWVNILNKPGEFNPTQHLHDVRDVYGFEFLVGALERLGKAITIGNVPAFETVMTWLETEMGSLRALYATNLDVWGEHIANEQNPHRTDKTQIGLGMVENKPAANAADVALMMALPLLANDQTIAVDKYVTLRRLLQFRNLHRGTINTELNQHTRNENNPHNTNKAQVGLAKVENLPVATMNEAASGVSNSCYLTPAGLLHALKVRGLLNADGSLPT